MSVTALRSGSPTPSATPYQTAVNEFASNEIIFGVVGAVGSGTSNIASALEDLLRGQGYDVSILKARSVLEEAAAQAGITVPTTPTLSQSECLQNVGDRLRSDSRDNAAVAVGLVKRLRLRRAEKQEMQADGEQPIEPDGTKRAYILDSLRHPHEVALLRKLYQDSFFLIGVYCHDTERLRRLRDEKHRDASVLAVQAFMERDENAPDSFGQKVGDTFHLADFFVDNTVNRYKDEAGKKREPNREWDLPEQLGRLIDILTHTKIVRPRENETGMFHAYGARLQSSCLSRQDGSALFDRSGSLISTGTNEVPRAGGGVYGSGQSSGFGARQEDSHDFRCFVHNRYCSNTKQQNEIIEELFRKVPALSAVELTDDLKKSIKKTQIGQLIEYSRAVHAEMDALMTAARTGAKTTGSRMYVTTFPCHNCARHIVCAGVAEVEYIEPYAKSKAIPLHGDAIVTDPKAWNPSNPLEHGHHTLPANVLFRPFIGVAPRLYRKAFFKDRDLKDGLSGDLMDHFGRTDGYATTEPLRVGYAQVEAKLANIQTKISS